MSNSNPKGDRPGEDRRLNLTQSIRELSVPTSASDDILADSEGRALLLTRDTASRKWGPRWLLQSGLRTQVPSDDADFLELARTAGADVILVDAGLTDDDGRQTYKTLLDAADLATPVIVLCNSNRDVAEVAETSAYDIARKPFEWHMLSRRAVHAWRQSAMHAQLASNKDALDKALLVADSARERLRSRETLEPVTGLPNKVKFVDLLKRGMSAIDRDNNMLAVFVIGFTRFRLVVEAMGQDQADLLLNEVGQNLANCMRTSGPEQHPRNGLRTAAVASLGPAHFGLMRTWSGDSDELAQFRNALTDTLSRPIQVAGQSVHLSACLGIATYPHDASHVDTLLQRADNAMRDAQSRGGGFKYYSRKSDAAAARKLRIEHMLHEALDRDELSLAYQPIVRTDDHRLTAAEVLLRWDNGDDDITPSEFIEVAEESGLMIRTGAFVLDEACRQLSDWQKTRLGLPRICVNVAKVQLMSGSFPSFVQRTLDKYRIEPGMLEIELSERGVLSGDYDVIQQLHDLRNLGVRLSIDDFGTGDSAIAYLKELPVDTLKIDQSYVAGLTSNSKDHAIASAMVALAHRLDLEVIAEGVETREQLDSLQALQCDAIQGFLISKAIRAQQFEIFIKNTS